MKVVDLFAESIHALLYHKLRSSLTLIGIIFGIASVVSMYAVGEGAQNKILDQLKTLGLNNIIIKKIDRDLLSTDDKKKYNNGLTINDFKSLKKLRNIDDIAYSLMAQKKNDKKTIVFNGKKIKEKICLVSLNYLDIMNISIKNGRDFVSFDYSGSLPVCILGSKVKNKISRLENPIGKYLTWMDYGFKIVGVLDSPTSNIKNIDIDDYNDFVYIPYDLIFDKLNISVRFIDQAIVKVKNTKEILTVAKYIDKVLQRKHRGVKDYKIVIPQKILMQSTKTQRIFNIVMGIISGISLLIGGIGVMNIMLANIMERTREIGIRRSVGAKKDDILYQFLFETIIVCIIGGIIGLLLGIISSYVIAHYTHWPIKISIHTGILAFLISSFVGVVSGLYPAILATNHDPVESLHYE